MSENKQIASAFVKAQKGFAPALKDTKNEFFKSKYADLSACVKAVIDSLNDNGIALIQHCHECDSGVTVETVFLHESGETLNCGKLHVPASKQDSQGYGSALTYARRYSLMAACGIAPEDDDGNAASKPVSHAHKPTDNPAFNPSGEELEYLNGIVTDVFAKLTPIEMSEYLESLKLDSDEKTFVWSKLDSKTRSGIKKANEERRLKNE